MNKFCTGKFWKNFISRYIGVFKRYMKDYNSQIYVLKLRMTEFITSLCEGLDPEIV